jgi:hypothetical protein
VEDLKTSIASVKEALASDLPEPKAKKGARKVAKPEKKVAKKVAKKMAKGNGGKPEKKVAAKEVDENVVTLAQLAAEAEIAPQSARVKLREAEVERPEGRWVWPVGSKALKEARKIIGLEV